MNNPKTYKVNVSGGIGFTGLLQIVFIVLKLCNVITWSWWLVFLPTLISLGLIVIGLLLLGIALAIELYN